MGLVYNITGTQIIAITKLIKIIKNEFETN